MVILSSVPIMLHPGHILQYELTVTDLARSWAHLSTRHFRLGRGCLQSYSRKPSRPTLATTTSPIWLAARACSMLAAPTKVQASCSLEYGMQGLEEPWQLCRHTAGQSWSWVLRMVSYQTGRIVRAAVQLLPCFADLVACIA